MAHSALEALFATMRYINWHLCYKFTFLSNDFVYRIVATIIEINVRRNINTGV